MGLVRKLVIWTLLFAVGIMLLIVLLISRGAPLVLFQQVQAELVPLGLNGVWHCLVAPTYVYDPSRDVPDARLVSERPESVLSGYLANLVAGPDATVADFTVERVEVDVRSTPGIAVLRTRLRQRNGGEEDRSFSLRASQTLRVSLDLPSVELMLCNKGLADWRVVQ